MNRDKERAVEISQAEAEEIETYAITPQQEVVIEHLLTGKSVTGAAAAAQLGRTTVSGWLNRDPVFIAALNRRLQQHIAWFDQRLRSLTEKAFQVIEEELDVLSRRGDAAKFIIKTSFAVRNYAHQFTPEAVELDLQAEEERLKAAEFNTKEREESRRRQEAMWERDQIRDEMDLGMLQLQHTLSPPAQSKRK
jgi:hypothetical protein